MGAINHQTGLCHKLNTFWDVLLESTYSLLGGGGGGQLTKSLTKPDIKGNRNRPVNLNQDLNYQ